jgi:hypothetical protein
MFASIGNLKAEDLVKVLDLWEADEKEEKKFLKDYADERFIITKGANCDDTEWNIYTHSGFDSFYEVEISHSELLELAEVEYAEVEWSMDISAMEL